MDALLTALHGKRFHQKRKERGKEESEIRKISKERGQSRETIESAKSRKARQTNGCRERGE